MAFFLLLCRDRPDATASRAEHRQRHLDYWADLPGVVKVAGAMLDGDRPTGSTFLVDAPDEASARQWLAGDPFATEGVFGDSIDVIRVRPAIGAWLPVA